MEIIDAAATLPHFEGYSKLDYLRFSVEAYMANNNNFYTCCGRLIGREKIFSSCTISLLFWQFKTNLKEGTSRSGQGQLAKAFFLKTA